jgi:hypothetical protein
VKRLVFERMRKEVVRLRLTLPFPFSDAKPADGRAYVSPPFLLEEAPSVHHPVEATSESEDDEPHLDPDDLAFVYKSAIQVGSEWLYH